METTRFPNEPELGELLSDYRLIRKLATTSMSVVYQAREVALGRDVALKVLHPNIAEAEAFQRRFAREVTLAASLSHPNVIPIHAKGDREGIYYVAMQYVDGPNLAQLVRERGRLDLPTTVRIAWQVASALGEAHRRGLVHRDVKPSNVLIDTRTWHAYLCDFGIAKQVSAEGLTLAGEFLGSTPYVAPEQIGGAELGPAADQYALGCAVYECLTGTPPYPPSDVASVLWAHMHEQPPRVADHAPDADVPAAVDDVIAKAMAKGADDRYESCDAFVAALAQAASLWRVPPVPPLLPYASPPPPSPPEPLTEPAASPPPAPPLSPRRPGRRLRGAAVTAVVLTVAAVLFAVADIPWPPSLDPHAGAKDAAGGGAPAASSAPGTTPPSGSSPSVPGSPTAGPSATAPGQTSTTRPGAPPGGAPTVAPTGPPQMRFLSPAAGATVSGVITMRVYVSNPAWLLQVEFQYLTKRCGGDDTYKEYLRSDKAASAGGIYEMQFDTKLAENGCLHLLAVGKGHDGELYPKADEGVYLRVNVQN